jgi:hypothetical protein
MKQCPNPECPHRLRIGAAAEFYDEISLCSDCGVALEVASETESRAAPASEARPATPPAQPRRSKATARKSPP